LTANNSAQLDYILGTADPYDSYEFEFINLLNASGTSASAGVVCLFQVGGTFQTTSYNAAIVGVNYTAGGNSDTKTSGVPISGVLNLNRLSSAVHGLNGIARLHAPRTATRVSMTVQTEWDNVGNIITGSGGGYYNAAGPVTGVRFNIAEGQNFTSGKIRVYGRQTS